MCGATSAPEKNQNNVTNGIQFRLVSRFYLCAVLFTTFANSSKMVNSKRHQGILGKEDHRHDADGIRFLLMQKSSLIMGQRFLIR